MNEKIKKLKEIIDGTDNLVFFGGAGVLSLIHILKLILKK